MSLKYLFASIHLCNISLSLAKTQTIFYRQAFVEKNMVTFFIGSTISVALCLLEIISIGTSTSPTSAYISMHLPERQKFRMVAILALGGLVCIVSIIGLHALVVVLEPTDSSLPALKPIVRKHAPCVLVKFRRTHYHSYINNSSDMHGQPGNDQDGCFGTGKDGDGNSFVLHSHKKGDVTELTDDAAGLEGRSV
ncbi:hypothetical protein BDY21DRAFT_366933 [Lineolata rhizophorae]|uniref:Uncharacterized protein n=1 Tax=Lineolata rhizophorae TaxID=578093 RepID=A0A6A6NQF7_9PEZI|nr:hypothetical protein BDY21DRAFT_366933 [Lineolata rhizophorae]